MEKGFYVKKIELNGNAVDNYPPISCLPLLRKLLTGVISDYLYFCLFFRRRENITGGTKDQLLLDKAVLRGCKRRSTNLAMA